MMFGCGESDPAPKDSSQSETLGSCQGSSGCLAGITASACADVPGAFTPNGTCQASCLPVLAGMTAWYTFDDRTGRHADDRIAGNTGTFGDNVVHADGYNGAAVRFPRDGDGIVAPGTAATDFGVADFTISALIRRAAAVVGPGILVEKLTILPDTTMNRGFVLIIDSPNSVVLQLADAPSGFHGNISSGPLPNLNLSDGKWHLVTLSVVRSKADGGRLFVDERVVWTFDPRAWEGSVDSVASLKFGDGLSGHALQGDLDELMFFKRALTQSEVIQLAFAGPLGVCKDPGTGP